MAEQRRNFLDDIWQATTKLSDESIEAARQKAQELKLDLNKGVVGFDETRINLFSARDILSEAVKHNRLIQLPLTVQQRLSSSLNQIVSNVTSIINGTDEIVLFAANVEDLNTSIWQFGLHNLSKEVLGFQTKMNQLKSQEVEARRILEQLRDVQKLKASSDEAFLPLMQL